MLLYVCVQNVQVINGIRSNKTLSLAQGLASSHRRGMLFSGAIPARQAYARDLITLVADFKLVLGGGVRIAFILS